MSVLPKEQKWRLLSYVWIFLCMLDEYFLLGKVAQADVAEPKKNQATG